MSASTDDGTYSSMAFLKMRLGGEPVRVATPPTLAE